MWSPCAPASRHCLGTCAGHTASTQRCCSAPCVRMGGRLRGGQSGEVARESGGYRRRRDEPRPCSGMRVLLACPRLCLTISVARLLSASFAQLWGARLPHRCFAFCRAISHMPQHSWPRMSTLSQWPSPPGRNSSPGIRAFAASALVRARTFRRRMRVTHSRPPAARVPVVGGRPKHRSLVVE